MSFPSVNLAQKALTISNTHTALTPATVMSCYRDNLPYSSIAVMLRRPSSSLIMDV